MSKVSLPVILIDGSSYLYRAFHALPPLMNARAEPTGAMYGFMNMLKKLLETYEPTHMAVIFDTPGKNFRHELHADYKAHRPSTPEDLLVQFEPLCAAIKAMGVLLIMKQGIEADDVIGTLAKQLAAQQLDVLIVTGDKDFAQLVNDRIHLLNTMTNVMLDRQGVLEKFGIPPEQFVDYLALIGDKVDNIPGIPNVGPKTAVKWLQSYESLTGIMEQAEHIKGKVGENLRAHLKELPKMKQLVTLQQDLHLDCDLDKLRIQPIDRSALLAWAKRWDIKSWQDALADKMTEETKSPPPDYQLICDKATLNQWLERIKQASRWALDTETTSLDPKEAKLVGIAIAVEAQAAYIPCGHTEALPQLDCAWLLEQFKPLLADSRYTVLGHNLKYDFSVLMHHGLKVGCQYQDTLLMSYVYSNPHNRHDLETVAFKYLGIRPVTYEAVAGKGKDQLSFADVPIAKALPYAAEDALLAWRLAEYLWEKIQQTGSLANICKTIEFPLIAVLVAMEAHGVLIDAQCLQRQSKILAKQLIDLEKEAHALVGAEFNLNSPKQLQVILYDKMNLPVVKKTPTGQPSTSESVLQTLAYDYPLADLVLRYRQLSKLKSTYTDALPLQINPQTKRVHTSYNQTVTATGRLSSTNPNLQNIPIRTAQGRAVRQAFIAPSGCVLVSADYSQIELRIMAHVSQDKALIKAFRQGLDIHRFTASEVFEVSVESVTDEQRRRAKAINFGLIYGMSAFGVAKQLALSREEAQRYIDSYFERYPSVKAYMSETCQQARKQGYVETLFGRRLFLPDIHAKQAQIRKAAERAAINAPLQGSAADLIKLAMIQIHGWLPQHYPEIAMIMQVHDELIFEVPHAQVEAFIPKIKKKMTAVVDWSVPLEVDVGFGANWDEAH